MTPQEKSKSLFENMFSGSSVKGGWISYSAAKECAITCCDEIISSLNDIYPYPVGAKEYWLQVKQHIQQL